MKNEMNLTSEKIRVRTKRVVTVLVSLILLFTVAVGASIAYMFMHTSAVTNTFTAATATTPTIEENFTDKGFEKSNVVVDVGNPGYAVYVRAKVVINWTNENGDALAVTPPVEGTDYEITYNSAGAWQYCDSDGFWYYKTPISSGDTKNLVDLCRVKQPAPIAGYTLQVDILTQTIQAAGTDANGKLAVESAWGATVNDDKTISK